MGEEFGCIGGADARCGWGFLGGEVADGGVVGRGLAWFAAKRKDGSYVADCCRGDFDGEIGAREEGGGCCADEDFGCAC